MASQIVSEIPPQTEFRRSAKALITASQRVLLIKEQHADGSNFWTLPGGGLDANESHAEALYRELAEELRCLATIDGPLNELWYAHRSSPNKISHCKVFLCKLCSSVRPNPAEGVFDHRWVEPDDLPPETLLAVRYTIENSLGEALPSSR